MKPFIVLLFATAAVAQTKTPSGVVVSGSYAASAGSIVSVISPGMRGEGITGAPYSALEVTENVQTLADGTHITQPFAKTMYNRDSQGRTRIERTFPLPPGAAGSVDTGPNVIEIHDPVAGVQYTLETRDHKARKITLAPPAQAPAPITPPTVASDPQSKPKLARLSTFVPNDQRQRPEISTESLGTQIIEGVTAAGSRTTVVYPVNFFGNDRPTTTVSETWTSPDLKLTVLSKNSDPRSGERTTRLTNISRAEPDPSLFQVPSDYEIVDAQPPRVVR